MGESLFAVRGMIPVLLAAGIYQASFLLLLSHGDLLYNPKPEDVSSGWKEQKESFVG